MSEQDKEVMRAVSSAFMTGDLDALSDHYDENVLYHGSGGEERRGRAAARELAAMYRNAFPDVQLEVDQLVAEGDLVFSLVRVSGTHQGDLPGLPANGRRMDLNWLANLVRISNGKIVEEWEVFDQADFMKQLGDDGPGV